MHTAIVFLYSHWEGFVKKAAQSYLQYVQRQDVWYDQLDDCFLLLAIKEKLEGKKSIKAAESVAEFIRQEYDPQRLRPHIPIELRSDESKKPGNLYWDYLKKNMNLIGVVFEAGDRDQEKEYKEQIDDLMKLRNKIAHGVKVAMSGPYLGKRRAENYVEKFSALREIILTLMERFQDTIYEHADHQRYLKHHKEV